MIATKALSDEEARKKLKKFLKAQKQSRANSNDGPRLHDEVVFHITRVAQSIAPGQKGQR